jgi:hypothetical protein
VVSTFLDAAPGSPPGAPLSSDETRTGRPGVVRPLAMSGTTADDGRQREALTRGPYPAAGTAPSHVGETDAHLGTRAANHLDSWAPAGII